MNEINLFFFVIRLVSRGLRCIGWHLGVFDVIHLG